ncbi:MAG TPA: MBL fold metallo-hydrolase [Roseiflexaceae bacterium]|jgi:ribonuclease Z|nr:MBL fold metallo-hydrolase [Roseiflexaceae bacterium]
MSISFQILGEIGRDNAAYVTVDSGSAVYRLLFDCGDCLQALGRAEVQDIDYLLFSHLHMDHVAGFDRFFRANYARADKPGMIWGPPATATIMHHRFRGFLWNLIGGAPGVWYVHDVSPAEITRWRFRTGEAFASAHPAGVAPFTGTVFANPAFTIEALHMEHRTPTLAYMLRERPRLHIDTARLQALALPPGAWLRQLKEPQPDEPPTLEIAGQIHELATLRAELLAETAGESLAYLTDFLLDDAARARLVPFLCGCDTLICESQYRHADLPLALQNYHMTATQVATLAREAGVGKLILFHVSERYRAPEYRAMLNEARAIFPNTFFPEHWQIDD